MSNRTTSEEMYFLKNADVPAGRVHDFESLTEDEHLHEIGFFRRVQQPVEGEMIDVANPNRFSAGLREDHSTAPLLGADSVAILSELGYGKTEIDEMIQSRSVIDGRQTGWAPAPAV